MSGLGRVTGLGTVARLGISPFKGGAHSHPQVLEVSPDGPVGDRTFALVEEHPSRGTAVVRTVENPGVLQVRAVVGGDGALSLELPGGAFTVPQSTSGTGLVADYWGRATPVHLLPGPWDAALSDLLGRPVRLARSESAGAVVYAQPVTLVTTSSLRELARRAAVHRVDDERFRATVLVDTGDAPPFVEDDLAGSVLRLGDVELEVTAHVPRCAVVRLVPGTGQRAPDDPLRLLAPDRTRGREIVFGVGAVVRHAGLLAVGNPVSLA